MVKKADKIVSIILIVISALLIYEARAFPKRASFAGNYVIFLALLLIIFSILILLSKDEKGDLSINHFPKLFFFIISTFVYIFLIPYIGFFTISFIYMVLLIKYFGVNRLLPLILTPLITLGFVYYIFVIFLTIQIPRGFLI